MKFRKKPIEIEAIPLSRANFDLIEEFTNGAADTFFTPNNGSEAVSCMIKTLEGDMKATEGDWIIKGVNGEFYPCKPDIFKKTYEKC